mmetsp:Transcript_21747/g.67008  ORF Transcript_21747/g.67008 Transcript_21747/m.67008 type:complete len:166 (-) Transcript_21747:126-623(-)
MATVKAVIRLLIPAQGAKPGPAIGQALGPHGLNMSDFVKEFNAATQKVPADTPTPVVLTVYGNRTFSFITKTPPASYLIRKELGLEKGSTAPKQKIVGTITMEQIRGVAAQKHVDDHVSHIPFDSFCRSVAGTALSMGLEVTGGDVASKRPHKRKVNKDGDDRNW